MCWYRQTQSVFFLPACMPSGFRHSFNHPSIHLSSQPGKLKPHLFIAKWWWPLSNSTSSSSTKPSNSHTLIYTLLNTLHPKKLSAKLQTQSFIADPQSRRRRSGEVEWRLYDWNSRPVFRGCAACGKFDGAFHPMRSLCQPKPPTALFIIYATMAHHGVDLICFYYLASTTIIAATTAVGLFH